VSVQAKWKANQDKVSFLKQFPGLLTSWRQTIGHTILHVRVLKSKPQRAVLIFSDGSFAVVSSPASEPQELTAGLLEARDLIEPLHPKAFVEYDRLDQLDKNAGQRARMENILGAIRNNLEQIPDLKDHIKQLVDEWESKR
jgi:hypothetical protein